MCQVLSVSRSGYYAWLRRPKSTRPAHKEELLSDIRLVHRANKGRYGSPRIDQERVQRGRSCSENRVARLMREDGLKAKTKRRYKATTRSKHDLAVAPNLLQRDFSPEVSNQVWAGDITHIRTTEGWLYLAVVIDLFSGSVVGWCMKKHMTRHLAWMF